MWQHIRNAISLHKFCCAFSSPGAFALFGALASTSISFLGTGRETSDAAQGQFRITGYPTFYGCRDRRSILCTCQECQKFAWLLWNGCFSVGKVLLWFVSLFTVVFVRLFSVSPNQLSIEVSFVSLIMIFTFLSTILYISISLVKRLLFKVLLSVYQLCITAFRFLFCCQEIW